MHYFTSITTYFHSRPTQFSPQGSQLGTDWFSPSSEAIPKLAECFSIHNQFSSENERTSNRSSREQRILSPLADISPPDGAENREPNVQLLEARPT